MLVSSIVGFNFGHPVAKSVNKQQNSSVQKQNPVQNQSQNCCPKGRKSSPNNIQAPQKLSLTA